MSSSSITASDAKTSSSAEGVWDESQQLSASTSMTANTTAATSGSSPNLHKPVIRRASVDTAFSSGERHRATSLAIPASPSQQGHPQSFSPPTLSASNFTNPSSTPVTGLPSIPLASSMLPWHHQQNSRVSPASSSASPLDIAQQQHGGPAGGGAVSGNPSSMWPGRAASLPGSLHHSQSQSSGRHQHLQTYQQQMRLPHSLAYLGASGSDSSARNAAGGGILPMAASYSPQGQQTTQSPLMRAAPQTRSLANGGNGSHSPGYYNIGAITPTHHHHLNGPSAISYERYTAELTNCIIAFLGPILPTEEEYRIKEATRRQLERLAVKVSPGAKLLAFGSMANGFALRNSDMDLCCLIARPGEHEIRPTASELVEALSQVIREETDFNVLALPKARIPIIKISRSSTSELPYEISCDIGFENRLALENTRLLLSYAMVDPPRLRTLVLFLKVWTKRRKLNSPYTGTLSSYGYTLLVLFYLTHVKRPAVLPNLQRVPPTRPMAPEEVELNGHNIYFYDDMATLRKEWQSQNTENVAELLIDFFRYFAKDHPYAREVISLKTETGLFGKDGITWSAELCIEDPFQNGYNVSRTVTKDGLYTIRGEFIRATRILQNRNQRVSAQLAELCEEREDFVARAPDTPPLRNRYQSANATFNPSLTPHHQLYDSHSQQRRINTAGGSTGVGGSFAFEEMARGLGRQRGQMAYPTTAMLAPLSQSGGLSPHPNNAGSRGGRDASTPGTRTIPRTGTIVTSSTRSDDGNSGTPYEDGRTRIAHTSARTSPTFASAAPAGALPDNSLGEAWAFGSEIIFGSERFRLHPHPRLAKVSTGSTAAETASARSDASTSLRSTAMATLPSSNSQPPSREEIATRSAAATSVIGNRATRSFSDGQGRSKSVGGRIAKTAAARGGLEQNFATLNLNLTGGLVPATLDSGESSGRISPTASSDVPSHLGAAEGDQLAPMQEYTAAWAAKQLKEQQAQQRNSLTEVDKHTSTTVSSAEIVDSAAADTQLRSDKVNTSMGSPCSLQATHRRDPPALSPQHNDHHEHDRHHINGDDAISDISEKSLGM